MNTAVKHSQTQSVKSTLKMLLILLPIFGLLAGIGLGLILANAPATAPADLYLNLAMVILPTVLLVGISLVRYFKQIDHL